MTNQEILSITIFFGLQLVNVILSTIRSIVTVRASRHTAAIINAISYTFYNGIVKLLTAQDMSVILATTFITNIIGVYTANFILDKAKKDKLWVFSATFKSKVENVNIETVVNMLTNANIKFVYNEVVPNKLYTMQIFSYTQKESDMIKEILKNFDVKYYITETKQSPFPPEREVQLDVIRLKIFLENFFKKG